MRVISLKITQKFSKIETISTVIYLLPYLDMCIPRRSLTKRVTWSHLQICDQDGTISQMILFYRIRESFLYDATFRNEPQCDSGKFYIE